MGIFTSTHKVNNMGKICFVVSNPKEIYEQLKSLNLHELCSYKNLTPGVYNFFIKYESMKDAASICDFVKSIKYDVNTIQGWEKMNLFAGTCSSIKHHEGL